MQINNHWHIASNDQRKKTELIVTPFQKDGGSRIPQFMRSLLEDAPIATAQAEEIATSKKKNAAAPEQKSGPMVLNESQRRRTARFYECWSTCSALIHLTDVQDIYVQHGRLVGRFLLNQLSRLNVNVQFHGFNKDEWPLNDHATLSEVTIHVYHDRATNAMIKDPSSIEVECFKPNVFFEVPDCLQEIIEGTAEDGINREYKRKLIVFFNFLTLMRVAEKIGTATAIVQNASMFGDQIMSVFDKNFPEAVRVGFPRDRKEADVSAPGVEFNKKLKTDRSAEEAVAAAVVESLTEPKPKKKSAPVKRAPVVEDSVSEDKLAELKAKFGKDKEATAA